MMPAVSAIPVNGIAGAALFSNSELTFFYTVTPDLLHPPLWENTNAVPLLIAASSCWNGQRLRAHGWPTQATGRFCDSGGFVFGRNRSCFPFDTSDYHVWLTAMQPNLAACLDLPCEAEIAADNAEVARRQAWTLEAAQQLLSRPTPWAWVPVVQGCTLEQYATHARAYRAAGLDQPLMGIGSLCRRTRTGEIRAIVATVAEELPGVRFHLFGVKLGLLKQRVALSATVASLDSGAWNGRFGSGIQMFNAEMRERGWTQRETAVRWALPRYAAKVTMALADTKQQAWC